LPEGAKLYGKFLEYGTIMNEFNELGLKFTPLTTNKSAINLFYPIKFE
jgi:hypothetical protein